MSAFVSLADVQPFARGGHRECYVDPRNPQRCIKIRRPDYPLTALRRDKGFPKNLKPLTAFDDNREEYHVLTSFERDYGEQVFRHVCQCFGFVDTESGRGLVLELVRNGDDAIARTLKEELWTGGMTPPLEKAITDLIWHWETLRLPSRHLLLHNIVVQRDLSQIPQRLVVIDGLGSPTLLPFRWLPESLQLRRVQRKTNALHQRVTHLLALREQQHHFPGSNGQLLHRDSPEERGWRL